MPIARLKHWAVLNACFISLLFSTFVQAEWLKHEFDVMGTRASVELWADAKVQNKKLFEAIEKEMRRIESVMSPYIEISELSNMNRLGANKSMVISVEMYTVVQKALYFSEITDGAFDISFASVGFLYDYRKQQQPSEQVLQESLPKVDYKSIQLAHVLEQEESVEKYTIQFSREGMSLDLGGIAKGYAVDRGIEILKEAGVESALVSAGGDTRIIGSRGKDKASGQTIPWVIGIKHPREKEAQALRLPLTDTALSTSGDYERFFIDGKNRVHHIIRPSTGKSAKGIVSATVIGEKSMHCDALSTSVFVLGVEDGIQLINTIEGYDAIIIDNNGKVHYSLGLAPQ